MAPSTSKGKASAASAGLSDAQINARYTAPADEDLREYIKCHNKYPWSLANPNLMSVVEWFSEDATYARLVKKRDGAADAGAEEVVLSVIGEIAGDSFRLQVDGDFKKNQDWDNTLDKTKRTARLAQPRDKLLAPLFQKAINNANALMGSRRTLDYKRRYGILEDSVLKVRQKIFEEKSVLVAEEIANKDPAAECPAPAAEDGSGPLTEQTLDSEVESILGIDTSSDWWMGNWECGSPEAQEQLGDIITEGKLIGMPLPAFRMDKSHIQPKDIAQLKGALVEIHFSMVHGQWVFAKADDYYADIRSIVVLRPAGYGTLVSSPMKRGFKMVMPDNLMNFEASPTKKLCGRK